MLHGMPTPMAIVEIAEAYGGIEALASRIALIYQEAYTGQTELGGLRLDGSQELTGDALTAIGGKDCKGVEIELASLRLVGHSGMVFA